MTEIRIFKSLDELYSDAAEIFLMTALEAQRQQSDFSVALSGGSTPLPLYRHLVEAQAASPVDWERIHFFWGDERPVGPDHPESNYRSAFLNLLQPCGVPNGNIHRIRGELQPQIAASAYEKELLDYYSGKPPRFDLILLGLGSDSHTASLFPGTDLVSPKRGESTSWVEAVFVAKLDSWRITFTPRLINEAAVVIFLAAGEGKARALNSVINGTYLPEEHPAQLIRPQNGKLIWLVDSQAAAEL